VKNQEKIMKLSTIEKQVVANIHSLPLDKQQFILEISALLTNKNQEIKVEKNKTSFAVFLKNLLKEIELEPLDINTSQLENCNERNIIEELLANPLEIANADSKPFSRDEIYASRKD
jgi:hypothetical protein